MAPTSFIGPRFSQRDDLTGIEMFLVQAFLVSFSVVNLITPALLFCVAIKETPPGALDYMEWGSPITVVNEL